MERHEQNEAARSSALAFARAMLPFWQQVAGNELLGVYLIGSLAHGGFSARYSDIDVAIVTEAGLSPAVLARARAEAMVLSETWGPRLSIFWTDRRFGIGRFPPLDRVDYADHALPLIERERIAPLRPTLSEIRTYLGGTPLRNWVDQAQRFAAASSLAPGDGKAYLRALLYPARFCFSWTTGRMASNDEAVEFLRSGAPPGLDLTLVRDALECRRAGADSDMLFGARRRLTRQIESCVALAGAAA